MNENVSKFAKTDSALVYININNNLLRNLMIPLYMRYIHISYILYTSLYKSY